MKGQTLVGGTSLAIFIENGPPGLCFLRTSKEKGVPFLNELSRTVPPTGIGTGNRPAAKWFPAGRRAGVPLWPVVCPIPAGGSAVKGRQRGG